VQRRNVQLRIQIGFRPGSSAAVFSASPSAAVLSIVGLNQLLWSKIKLKTHKKSCHTAQPSMMPFTIDTDLIVVFFFMTASQHLIFVCQNFNWHQSRHPILFWVSSRKYFLVLWTRNDDTNRMKILVMRSSLMKNWLIPIKRFMSEVKKSARLYWEEDHSSTTCWKEWTSIKYL
jgi:hypothetical protein